MYNNILYEITIIKRIAKELNFAKIINMFYKKALMN